MERINVISSTIKSVGYHDESSTLVIVFKSGGTYSYADVPKDRYEALLKAQSPGKYFAAQIRDKYVTKKLAPKPEEKHGEEERATGTDSHK